MQLSKKKNRTITAILQQPACAEGLFVGSYVRDTASADSDVDILVDLDYTQHIGFGFVKIKAGT